MSKSRKPATAKTMTALDVRMDMTRFVFDGGEGVLMPMRAGD